MKLTKTISKKYKHLKKTFAKYINKKNKTSQKSSQPIPPRTNIYHHHEKFEIYT